MTDPYGFTADDNALFGAIFLISGLIGAFTVSSILDKSPKYALMSKINCFATTVAAILGLVALPQLDSFHLSCYYLD